MNDLFGNPVFTGESYTDDDWLTPPSLLKSLGQFDTDPCSPIRRPWDTAKKHFTIADDGLAHQWDGRVWLNPPYSNVEPWLERMAKHNNGIALVNARTETQWFFDGIWKVATAVFFPKTRLIFYRPNGTVGEFENGRPKMGQVFAAYNHENASALYGINIEGKFIPLVIKLGIEIRTTWRALIRFLLRECGGVATLEQLYELVSDHPKAQSNPNWKAKVRQIVQREATRVGSGTYARLAV